ncbi:SgcJ/EcaC family oxidoreductase [Kitasatospora paranensis]|uniref:SgcJ/EcaC family oxidoreductase n=2 Tax=Kitasatospora paranensis TaxID=258053 RepID=A0ABW2G3Q9_9ACTN
MSEDVAGLYRALLDGWNRGDAGAFAACFADHGSMVGFDGSTVGGRPSIERHLAAVFADHRTAAYVARVDETRPLGPDTALLRAVAGMVPPGASDLNPALNAVQSLLARRSTGGDWRIEHFQTTPAAFHGRPEESAQLTRELREVLRGRG